MIVVLDTNIWLKELGLSTGVRAAFRFYDETSRSRHARSVLGSKCKRTFAAPQTTEDVAQG